MTAYAITFFLMVGIFMVGCFALKLPVGVAMLLAALGGAIEGGLGFETIRNFNRVFRQITGYSPRELPDGYVLNLRSNSGNATNFDPTIRTSELMYE